MRQQTLTLKEPRTAPPRQRTVRDPRWDNLRFLAGAGVLLIHVTDFLPGRDGLHWLYLATWALRIPLFALLAGYFSSATPLSRGRGGVWRLVESLLVPYLAVQLVACLELWAMSGADELWTLQVHNTGWTLWFLLALFVWRLALPYLARLRYPLATSVVVSLIAGYLPLDPLPMAASRTVGMLPFFLLGWKLRQGGLDPLMRAGGSREAAVAVLAGSFVAAWFVKDHVSRDLLTFRLTYEQLGLPVGAPLAWTVRCLVILAAMAVTLSVIRLVPRRRVPFLTYLGSGGLYIYLLHGLLLRPLNAADAFAWVGPWTEQALLVLICLAAAAALASPPVRRLARPMVQPRLPGLARILSRHHTRLRSRLPRPRRSRFALTWGPK
jgi:fucose 4-O-acetylase-like acetyltransferase